MSTVQRNNDPMQPFKRLLDWALLILGIWLVLGGGELLLRGIYRQVTGISESSNSIAFVGMLLVAVLPIGLGVFLIRRFLQIRKQREASHDP